MLVHASNVTRTAKFEDDTTICSLVMAHVVSVLCETFRHFFSLNRLL